MKKPNFFIIGAPKCGTTALSEYLRSHPNVFLSSPKEPNFLADDLKINPYYIKTWNDYLNLFSQVQNDHVAIGEASVWYLYSTVAVKNIYRLNKNAKLIIMLRNPVDMVYSYHSQMLQSSRESETDFKKAWQLQTLRKKGECLPKICREPVVLNYSQVARYSSQVERVFNTFPEEQIKVILFDDFITSTQHVYEKVTAFLGVPSDNRRAFPVINQNKVTRIVWFEHVLASPPPTLLRLARKLSKLSGRNLGGITRPIRRLNTRKESRPPLDPAFRAELVEFFREDVAKLARLIDRDLSMWV